MIIFLDMVKTISTIMRCNINDLRAEPAAPDRIWAVAALPARGGAALMTRRAAS
jgi:hypothetical protein